MEVGGVWEKNVSLRRRAALVDEVAVIKGQGDFRFLGEAQGGIRIWNEGTDMRLDRIFDPVFGGFGPTPAGLLHG